MYVGGGGEGERKKSLLEFLRSCFVPPIAAHIGLSHYTASETLFPFALYLITTIVLSGVQDNDFFSANINN